MKSLKNYKPYTLNEDDLLVIVEFNGGFELPNRKSRLLKNLWQPVEYMCEKISLSDLCEMAELKDCSPALAYVSEDDYDFLIYSYALNLN